jgi:hypothetical protein
MSGRSMRQRKAEKCREFVLGVNAPSLSVGPGVWLRHRPVSWSMYKVGCQPTLVAATLLVFCFDIPKYICHIYIHGLYGGKGDNPTAQVTQSIKGQLAERNSSCSLRFGYHR